MNRRGRGEGLIRKRKDGLWESRVKRNGRTESFYGHTRGEVVAALNATIDAHSDGLPSPDKRITVAQFCERWLPGYAVKVKASTHVRYAILIRKQIVPTLGHIRLVDLTPTDVTGAYAKLMRDGLSAQTTTKAHKLLGQILGDAEAAGVIARNVQRSRAVHAPRVPHREMQTLTAEQSRAVLHAADADRLSALYVLALSTGARQGELFALRWSDVDLNRGIIRIRRTLTRAKGAPTFTEPKTAAGRRSVPIGASAVEALRRHKWQQAEERLRNGIGGAADDALVFATEVGTPLSSQNFLTRTHYPLLKVAGVPRVRFHDLRHTAATLMLERGVHPRIMAERLGHANPSITMSVYAHVSPSMGREAADVLDAVLTAAQ
jgi:integrase